MMVMIMTYTQYRGSKDLTSNLEVGKNWVDLTLNSDHNAYL